MTRVAITGWGVVCSAGVGRAGLDRVLAAGPQPALDVSRLYPGELPRPFGHAYLDFDHTALLGRKGTSSLDRATALALVACGQAIDDSGLVVDDDSRPQIGVVLGTTVGSLRSSSDFSRETLVQERPYLVNPVLFPNTVMNCAAGQAAIRYGLRGVNATIAAGPLAFVGALRYAMNALRRGYAATMLVGAVEEFSPHRAWARHLLGLPGVAGEAAVVFVLTVVDETRPPARDPMGEVLSAVSGFAPDNGREQLGAALSGQVQRAVKLAGAPEVGLIATAGPQPATALDGWRSDRIAVEPVLGDCGAATGALQLAALMLRLPTDHGSTGLITGCSTEGAVGAAVVRVGSMVPA